MARRARSEPIACALLRTQSDARLVQLTREGREAAFEEIVRRYRLALVAFASAYVPRDRAEDVVQESLERSWLAIRDSDRELQLKPWLYTVVRNAALNARRQVRYDKPLDENVDGVRRPDEIVLERAELDQIVAAVSALPDQQRAALVRNALDGRTHDQIATALGTTPGSVRGLIHRARTTVRNGAGAIVPLGLLRMMLDSGTAEAGAAVAVGAGAAGGGTLLGKGAVVAAIGAVAIGSGVAIERSGSDGRSVGEANEAAKNDPPDDRSSSGSSPVAPSSSSGEGGGNPGPGGASDNHGSSGSGSGSSGGGGSGGPGPSESSGPGSEGELEAPELDDSGPGRGSSGTSGDDSGPGDDDGASGSSGSGTSGSGSSGSGSGGSGGSGSEDSGSGSGSFGSSFSGGELDEAELDPAELGDSSGSG